MAAARLWSGRDRNRWLLRTADLEYDLPPDLIAVAPVEPRDAARLLVVRRAEGLVEHRHVRNLPDLLQAGDCLVFNTSRVLPARFRGTREGTGGRVEGLYLRDAAGPGRRWAVLLEHPRAGARLVLQNSQGAPSGIVLNVIQPSGEEQGAWDVEVEGAGHADSASILARVGITPLPPYILRARRAAELPLETTEDRERYQTVYAEPPGSVAAPTAGLHFTPGLLRQLEDGGVRRADIILHVGVGTFRPVETEFVEQHPIHAEWCSATPEAMQTVAEARRRGARVVCVGTTSVRAIETMAADPARRDQVHTRLLITPGYPWRVASGLLTNFHLPRSTLMALVAALLPGGVDQLKSLYCEAVSRKYRFYSYGDAMLIL